jgi:hypothetical protein
MLGTLVPAVKKLREAHPRVEDLLSWLDLPVLPVAVGPDAFDAALRPPRELRRSAGSLSTNKTGR